MRKPDYEISTKALNDLDEIWTYTMKTWSTRQADRYYQLIFDEIEYICSNTDAGKPMEHIRQGYRASKVKSHLIFYKVSGDLVQIVRILHERMDLNNKL